MNQGDHSIVTQCSCCGHIEEDTELLENYRLFRINCGQHNIQVPTSGYRCILHNKAVGGGTNSAHLRAKAVDIPYRDSREAFIIVRAAIASNFLRIFVYLNKKIVHFDCDHTLNEPAFGVLP